MNFEKHPLHIKNPELQTSEDVQDAVEKRERLTGEDLPNDPAVRIEAYMDRLENVFLNKNEKTRERNIEILKPAIYDTLLAKKDIVIDEMLKNEQRIAEDQGYGIVPIREEMLARPKTQEQADTVIKRQKESLDNWIDYLSSDEAQYPAWFKYLVWNNVIKLQSLVKEEIEDKETGEKKIIYTFYTSGNRSKY